MVYFTSEQRVDFRNLVHDLSQQLRTRVEMRQVGVRDEAKFLGGLREVRPRVVLRLLAARVHACFDQDGEDAGPSAQRAEVSGVCGRLLCCLAYENDFYSEARKQMPRVNSLVETPDGVGKVRQVHVLANIDHGAGRGSERNPQLGPDAGARAAVHAAYRRSRRRRRGDETDVAGDGPDELGAQDAMDPTGEDLPGGRGRGAQQTPDEADGAGSAVPGPQSVANTDAADELTSGQRRRCPLVF